LGHDVDQGSVFVDSGGGFLRPPNVRLRSFLPILKRAALPVVRVYDLRHTAAPLLLASDVNIKVVSERLGHQTIGITLDHYAHALPSMQQRAVAAVEKLFGEESGTDSCAAVARPEVSSVVNQSRIKTLGRKLNGRAGVS
jgi:hypothetical protein